MKLSWRRIGIGAAILWTCGPLAHANVIVVDAAGGPGSNFTFIRAAIAAAAEGDTLLVRDGMYSSFQIVGKSLTVVADGPSVELLEDVSTGLPTIEVRNLSSEQEVLIRGFHSNFGFLVANCAGSVWFDELSCTGDSATCTAAPIHGASVRNSSRVTFTRCELVGEFPPGGYAAFQPGAGLEAVSSIVHLFDSTFTGGYGESSGIPIPGGPGLWIEGSTVTVVGCTITGGAGGVDTTSPCSATAQHAPGGAGIAFVGENNVLRSAQSPAAGGQASLNPFCPGQLGPQGPTVTGSGTIVALPGSARHVSANSPLRGGETLSLQVEGGAGELPFVLVSRDHKPLPLLNASLLVSLVWDDVLVLPPLDENGAGTLALTVPNVGPLVASLGFYAQAVFLDQVSKVWLGPGTTILLLDASF